MKYFKHNKYIIYEACGISSEKVDEIHKKLIEIHDENHDKKKSRDNTGDRESY